MSDKSHDYAINEHGIITSPGKFEGEPHYVPHYWARTFIYDYDADGDGTYIFHHVWEDYPDDFEPGDCLELWQDCNGFVHSRVRTQKVRT